jgi:hypothetical protein
MALEGSIDYLAVKIGSASELGWVLLVYLMSNPSEETPGTRKSLDTKDIRSYMPIPLQSLYQRKVDCKAYLM